MMMRGVHELVRLLQDVSPRLTTIFRVESPSRGDKSRNVALVGLASGTTGTKYARHFPALGPSCTAVGRVKYLGTFIGYLYIR